MHICCGEELTTVTFKNLFSISFILHRAKLLVADHERLLLRLRLRERLRRLLR